MSDSTTDTAGLIAQATQYLFIEYVVVSGTALVFYDYALTFSAEISEIWRSKFSGAQALFFLTRYSFIFFTVLFFTINFIQNPSQKLCHALSFSAAVWNITTPIVILGLTGVANVALEVSITVMERPEAGSSVYGTICGKDPLPTVFRIQLASVITSFIIDVLVFTLTFAKTIRHTLEMRKVGLRNSLGYFILRDGALYFLAKLLFGVVNATVFFVPASGSIGNWLGVSPIITNTLTVILINRLVLNLRRVSHVHEGNMPTLGAIGTIQEPVFATNSLLGNLGAPLRVGSEEGEIEETDAVDEAVVIEEFGTVEHSEIIEESRRRSDA